MLDRRYILSALTSLAGAAATDAVARAKKKKAAAHHESHEARGKKGRHGRHEEETHSRHGRHETHREIVHHEEAPPAPPAPPPPPSVTSPEAAAALKAAFDSILHEELASSPTLLTSIGLDKGEWAGAKSRLDDRSAAGKAADTARLRRAVNALNTVDRDQLAGMDRINYDTVLWDNQTQLQGAQGFAYGDNGTFSGGFPNPYILSQLSGAYQFVPDFLDSQHSIATSADADAYIARLSAFPRMLDQETQRAQADFARGVIPPDFILTTTLKQLTALRDVDPASSTLINSVDTRTTAAGLTGTWKADATALVTGAVKDALNRQIDALTAVQPRAQHDAGVGHLPNGDAYYAFCVKSCTSTGMTPQDIHDLGLAKVAELSAEIDTRLRAQELTQGTPGQRMRAMYTDPKFLYPNTDDGKARLLADLQSKVDAVQARLPQWFGALPKAKVQIRRVPVATEAGAPGGYYNPGSIDGSRPGAYYINLRDTAQVPSWTLPTLTYHESIPGHHLQGTIQQESDLPMLRKLSGFNAYVEGWALYAEQLAGEMGMYDTDPWGRIGYLHDALFRAVRLVVDTGMHSLGWSREQAIAYMVDKAANDIGDATAEIERYCVWPGQALGYMVGKLTWLQIRDAAKAKASGSFDIKHFHDTGLLCGAVPLDVLGNVYKDAGMI